MKLVLLVLSVLSLSKIQCNVQEESTTQGGIFSKIKHGLKMAGKLIGIDHAGEVAKLVNEAFASKRHEKVNPNDNGSIFSGLLRILGFDVKKIGAIAVNAVIFFAQMIGAQFSSFPPSLLTTSRSLSPGTPKDWLLKSPKVIELLTLARDPALPGQIIEHIKERSLDEETDCVQLLVCKASPFVWAMQRSLDMPRNASINRGIQAMFSFLPTLEDVAENGDKCDKKHPYCTVYM